MNFKILMTILVAFSLSSFVFAQQKDAKKEEPKKYVEGEKAPGQGYKLYFNDKESFVKLSGFTNIDLNANAAKKITMPYFRFYLDGQSNKNWSWHTRFDYSNTWFLSKATSNEIALNSKYDPNLPISDTNFPFAANPNFDPSKAISQDNHPFFETNGKYNPSLPISSSNHPYKLTHTKYGAYGLYFARAYTTYTFENFSIDFGRILNQDHRFDILNSYFYGYDVGLGTHASYKLGDLNTQLTLTYNDKTQQMQDQGHNEQWSLGGRADYTFNLIGGFKLNAGLAFFTDMGYSGEKYIDWKPHLYLTSANLSGLYFVQQLNYKNYLDVSPTFYELYSEIGMDVPFLADHYIDLTNTITKFNPDAETKIDIGMDYVINFQTDLSVTVTLGMSNLTNVIDYTPGANGSTDTEYSHRVRLGYNF